jgi:PIN domain nuclease of toxin-antitoxin system
VAQSVLDAWCLVALLRGEPSAPRVRRAIEAGAVCSWINLGEVIYREGQAIGVEPARALVTALADNLRAETADAALVCEAAAIKAQERLSYADAFCVATAERHGLPLLTGDPEIIRLDRPGLEVVDLRSAS